MGTRIVFLGLFLMSLRLNAQTTDSFPSYDEFKKKNEAAVNAVVQRLRKNYLDFLADERDWHRITVRQPSLAKPIKSHERPYIHPLGRQPMQLLEGFGNHFHPIYERRRFNPSAIWAVTAGTSVYAAAAGKVLEVGEHANLGIYIIISHGNGFSTAYAHLNQAIVRQADAVAAGQLLAYTGQSGLAPQPQFRYEVITPAGKDNPLNYCLGYP